MRLELTALPLSYGRMVQTDGFEPPTYPLETGCSSPGLAGLLSYVCMVRE